MTSISIWTRLGNWLRLSQNRSEGNVTEVAHPEQAHTTDSLTVANEPVVATDLAGAKRWQRREQVLQKLQEGYEQVIDLLSSVRQHLESSREHDRRTNEAITRLAETMDELPAASSQQTKLLDQIGRQMEEQGSRQEKIAGVVEQWPETARSQSQSLDLLLQELRTGQEAQSELAAALESVNRAVHDLAETASRGDRRIEALERAMGTRQEQMLSALEAQDKRVIWLVWTAMGLAGAAIVGALIAILMHYGSGT